MTSGLLRQVLLPL